MKNLASTFSDALYKPTSHIGSRFMRTFNAIQSSLFRRREVAPHDALRQIRSYDFASCDDIELRNAIAGLKCVGADADAILPKTFALVSEAVERRLGVWRLFDSEFPKPGLNEYERIAEQILESAPYRNRMDFYTNPDFLETDGFAESLAPALSGCALDDDEKTIVKTMVYVAEKSKVAYSPNILLPANFYRAIAAKDVGRELEFLPHDEQLLAGVLLYRGTIVEMNAGEGKTVAAAFPAALHTLTGRAVHIITANDYLAARDADYLAPVYESLGLTVGAVLGYMGDEERRYAYQQQIVYGTLREFGFDFLRDNTKLPPDEPLQGALDVAIVDEADHVLIDQARTPLIISGEPIGNKRGFDKTRRAVEDLVALQSDMVRELESKISSSGLGSRERIDTLAKLFKASSDNDALVQWFARSPRDYKRALAALEADEFRDDDEKLTQGLFYTIDAELESVTLTEKGQQFIEERLGSVFNTLELAKEIELIDASNDIGLRERTSIVNGLSRRMHRQNSRMNQVYQMLRAYVLLKKEVHYVVTNGEIVLIDEFTGRTLSDSRYQQGLHAAIEAKERVPVHPETETLAQISVRGFVRQYARVAGMTGTAADASVEFEREYGLGVVQLPPNQPSMRTDFDTRLYTTRDSKLAAILDEIKFCREIGRPVLVGTLTIEQSEEISHMLTEEGIEHSLLNAVTNSDEAEIIRSAGTFGKVTIATNMAGRGTDIILEPGLNERIAEEYEALMVRDGSTSHAGLSNTVHDNGRSHAVISKTLGLYVIGTEMNYSSRIDRQLRGRAGRQGAFGASRFIVSLEDRMFAFHGDDFSINAGEPSVDVGGMRYSEGLHLERELDAVRSRIERDDEIRRGVHHEYARVMEAQTLAYYRMRRQVMESNSFHHECLEFVVERTERLVQRHFPELRIVDYESQFDRLAEELSLEFGIDCYRLEGVGLDRLAHEVGALLSAKLNSMRTALGDVELESLQKILFLQTTDALWRAYLVESQEMLLSNGATAHSHKAAIADYVFECSKAYLRLMERIVDIFLPKLSTFPVKTIATSQQVVEVDVIEDVAQILA